MSDFEYKLNYMFKAYFVRQCASHIEKFSVKPNSSFVTFPCGRFTRE